MPRTYQEVSSYAPSLFLAPLLNGPNAAGKAAIEAAVGTFIEGIIQGHSEHPGANGSTSHFYEMLIERAEGVVNCAAYLADSKSYQPIPFAPNEIYSVKAPAQLHYKLANVPTGCPIKITYMGVKTYEKNGSMVTSHQFGVGRDTAFQVALPAPAEASQITYDDAVEEPI